MIKTILLWLLACLIIAFIAVWIWTGGIGKVRDTSKSFTNIFDVIFFRGEFSGSIPGLPWQPEFPAGPDISEAGTAAGDGGDGQGLQERYASLVSEYDALSAEAAEAKTFGDPSPVRGQVLITEAYGAKENIPPREYIAVSADSRNTAPIDMDGWSLQSVYTGIRAYIPTAASSFMMGVVNDRDSIQLPPGASAIINSGMSPVGTSFRENICTGYLEQLQNFSPSLSNSCPTPASSLPLTPENLRIYGETCFDFLQTIPSCTSPLQNIPGNISSDCRSFALNTLSYNGCVLKNRFRPSFITGSWRIYLESDTELWRNTHDIIRLLDGEGRTVDVLTY